MVYDAVDILAMADDLGDALERALHGMDPDDFDRLIAECNALVREITQVNPDRYCVPPAAEPAGPLTPSVRDVTGRA